MSSDINPPPITVASGLVPAIIPPVTGDPNPPTLPVSTTRLDLTTLLDQLSRPSLRASGLVFGWCVTDANFDLEPTIIKAQFGDGYAQRRAAGINTQTRKWNLSMKNIDAKTATAVLDFLSARNGVDIFNWTPPRTATPEDVICPSWNSAYGDLLDDGTRLFTITMKFEDAFV
jgi:phage-related protein